MSAVEECVRPASGDKPPGYRSLLELVDEPSPATDVGAMLRLYRERRYPFEEAWSRTLRSLPQSAAGIEEWRFLLHRTKPTWKAAYEWRCGSDRVRREAA